MKKLLIRCVDGIYCAIGSVGRIRSDGELTPLGDFISDDIYNNIDFFRDNLLNPEINRTGGNTWSFSKRNNCIAIYSYYSTKWVLYLPKEKLLRFLDEWEKILEKEIPKIKILMTRHRGLIIITRPPSPFFLKNIKRQNYTSNSHNQRSQNM